MHWIKRAFVLFLLLWSGVSLAQTIDAMRLSETPSSGVRFVADLDDKADVKVFRLENPSRLVMDFSRTRFGQKIAPLSPTGFIKGFRTGQPNAQTARIVLDLPAFELTEKHFLLSPQTGKNWRFVLDIDKVKKNKTSPKETAIPSKKSIPTKKIIVLDPGHGGQDPGAISISGKYEKDLTLKMAKETKVLLEKQGYKVVLTRDKDFYIPLRDVSKKPMKPMRIFLFLFMRTVLKIRPHKDSVFILFQKQLQIRKQQLWPNVKIKRIFYSVWI